MIARRVEGIVIDSRPLDKRGVLVLVESNANPASQPKMARARNRLLIKNRDWAALGQPTRGTVLHITEAHQTVFRNPGPGVGDWVAFGVRLVSAEKSD